MTFAKTLRQFQQNFATLFLSSEWLGAIDFSKFMIAGGSVVNALCNLRFPDTREQAINLFHVSSCGTNFASDVENTISRVESGCSIHMKHLIKVEKMPFLSRYDVVLPCGINLSFVSTPAASASDPMSHVLHNFDTDISQIAFTGNYLLSSSASQQSICVINRKQTPLHVCLFTSNGNEVLHHIQFEW